MPLPPLSSSLLLLGNVFCLRRRRNTSRSESRIEVRGSESIGPALPTIYLRRLVCILTTWWHHQTHPYIELGSYLVLQTLSSSICSNTMYMVIWGWTKYALHSKHKQSRHVDTILNGHSQLSCTIPFPQKSIKAQIYLTAGRNTRPFFLYHCAKQSKLLWLSTELHGCILLHKGVF